MAIIRNDRNARRELETQDEAELEEEIDYTWHPNEDEFVSPLTADQWAELLGDASFAETDAARAVRCLFEYGEPATFQQLSIRYRGTMGRYRRWLAEAAQAAGERFGVPAPQQDQFGMDEWWPLLYRVRNTGKPGAGIVEMLLRPEVQDAYELIAEQERQAKRAENMRNLKRIEQLERARQEERERRAAKAAEAAERRAAREKAAQEKAELEAAQAAALAAQAATQAAAQQAAAQQAAQAAAQAAQKDKDEQASLPVDGDATVSVATPTPTFLPAAQVPATQAEAPAAVRDSEPTQPLAPKPAVESSGFDADEKSEPEVVPPTSLPAMEAFLSIMAERSRQIGSHFALGSGAVEGPAFDMAAPVDYALRYAERLRHALALMREGMPRLGAAAVAREMGDESVEELQGVLNGQHIPTFAYIDRMRDTLFVNVDWLETCDGQEDSLPVFCTLDELLGPEGAARALEKNLPCEIVYVVDDAKERRAGVIIRYSDLRCVLLTRSLVSAESPRSESPELQAYVRMVDELDAYAQGEGIPCTTKQIGAGIWDKLVAGSIWPGAILR